jgi:hypothetical protein
MVGGCGCGRANAAAALQSSHGLLLKEEAGGTLASEQSLLQQALRGLPDAAAKQDASEVGLRQARGVQLQRRRRAGGEGYESLAQAGLLRRCGDVPEARRVQSSAWW